MVRGALRRHHGLRRDKANPCHVGRIVRAARLLAQQSSVCVKQSAVPVVLSSHVHELLVGGVGLVQQSSVRMDGILSHQNKTVAPILARRTSCAISKVYIIQVAWQLFTGRPASTESQTARATQGLTQATPRELHLHAMLSAGIGRYKQEVTR